MSLVGTGAVGGGCVTHRMMKPKSHISTTGKKVPVIEKSNTVKPSL